MTFLETVRSVRIGGFAVFDFASAFAGMYLLAPHLKISRARALWMTLPIGILSHMILGIDTPLNQMVIGDNPNRLAQLTVAFCLYQALTCCANDTITA